MRHLIKTLFFSTIFFSSLAIATKMNITPTVTSHARTIMVDQDERTFTITLASTPSTGFTWLLSAYNTDLLILTKHQYIPPSKNMPGASGVENWTFTVNPGIIAGPQMTKITLINARMWDVNNTNASTTFTVVIE